MYALKSKLREKLDYMHNNPGKAGPVKQAVDRSHSSARRDFGRRRVGVDMHGVV